MRCSWGVLSAVLGLRCPSYKLSLSLSLAPSADGILRFDVHGEAVGLCDQGCRFPKAVPGSPPSLALSSLRRSHLHWLLALSFCFYSRINLFVQLLRHVQFFATPWTAARQASLSFTISWSLHRLVSIESLMLSNHLIYCCPFLLLHQGLFRWFSSLHQVAKVLELQLQHQSFQWIFRVDFL